jgi:hypothetical protein
MPKPKTGSRAGEGFGRYPYIGLGTNWAALPAPQLRPRARSLAIRFHRGRNMSVDHPDARYPCRTYQKAYKFAGQKAYKFAGFATRIPLIESKGALFARYGVPVVW